MTDDYKKGYADAMGWKIENYLEHLPEQKPIAWYDPTNGMVSADKDSPLFTPLGQVLPLYTKQEDDGITLTTIRHPRGKPALGDLNPESLETVEIDLPEPVAWGVFEGNLHDMFFNQEEAQKMADLKGTHAEVRPLYATPPQRKPLTDEEVLQNPMWKWYVGFSDKGKIKLVREIEAAHGIGDKT